MNEPFIPLAIAASAASAADTSAAESFRPKVVPQAGAGQPFRPILESLRHSHANGAAGPAAQPKITLKRDGDRVTHIRIQCACGQEFELACEY